MTIIQIQLSESSLFDDIELFGGHNKKALTGVMPDYLKDYNITIIFLFTFLKIVKNVKVFNKSYRNSSCITTCNQAFILTLKWLDIVMLIIP